MKNNKGMYYSLVKNNNRAVLNIFGDITSYAYEEYGEMSNVLLSKKLEEIGNVDVIDVFINSYGGEVSEGLAIYNALKRNKAKIVTHVDGFACSIASVIFMAGDERIMPNTSCLMIHNPWVYVIGNAEELRKQAEDLEVIGNCSINAYMEHVNISLEELQDLLDKESWLSPEEAVSMGFATSTEEDAEDTGYANASVKGKIISMLISKSKEECNSNVDIENKTNEEETEENNSDDVTENEQEDTEPIETESTDKEVTNNETEENNESEKVTNIISQFLENLEREMIK